MKKILMIADLASSTNDIFKSLAETYEIKISPFQMTDLNAIYKSLMPDAVIIFIKDLNRDKWLPSAKIHEGSSLSDPKMAEDFPLPRITGLDSSLGLKYTGSNKNYFAALKSYAGAISSNAGAIRQ